MIPLGNRIIVEEVEMSTKGIRLIGTKTTELVRVRVVAISPEVDGDTELAPNQEVGVIRNFMIDLPSSQFLVEISDVLVLFSEENHDD